MKRVLSLILALVMLFSLAACSGAARRARVQIVTTSFPLYDWTRNIVGDTEGVEITWLMDSGVDPHSFQPTTKDLVFVSDCDVFVYVGGESEAWADDAVASMKNENARVVKLLGQFGNTLILLSKHGGHRLHGLVLSTDRIIQLTDHVPELCELDISCRL